jgi:phospholipase C
MSFPTLEPAQVPAIDHVIVVVLENRSFDHMLGFLEHPNPAFERLTEDGRYANPGWAGGPAVSVSPNAKRVLPIGPDHSHDGVMEQLALDRQGKPTNQGFVASLERAGRSPNRAPYGGLFGWAVNWFKGAFRGEPAAVTGLGPLAMRCQPSSQIPVLSQLARDFAVCTRWFCSVPGETWPNRNFLHAATSDGETDIDVRFYENTTIFELLEKHGKTWHIYYDDTPQIWAFHELWDTPQRHANWYPFADFLDHVAVDRLPSYSFIEPNHRPPLRLMDDETGADSLEVSNNQHPENNLVSASAYDAFGDSAATDFARAETLIATIYEALRANPALFDRSLLLLTYDEHGGFYDREAPPVGVPSPGTKQEWGTRLRHLFVRRKSAHFDFTMLGPRVPAVVISPYVPAGTVDDTVHDHSSVPKTLRQIFAADAHHLTARDEWAQPFHTVLSLTTPRRTDLPDLSRFVGSTAGQRRPGVEPTSLPPVHRTGAAEGPFAQSYQAFLTQAEHVHRRLVRVGEVEAARPSRAVTPRERATETTQIFSAAAQRHREQQRVQGDPSSGLARSTSVP